MDFKKVAAEAELTAAEFKKIQASMQTNLSKAPAPKKRVTPTKEPESPSKKLKKEADSAWQVQLRKLKQSLDRMLLDMAKMRNDISKLGDKGYPAAMEDWCMT